MEGLDLTWDAATAAVAIVLGCLVFLMLVRKGFRPMLVG